MSRPRKRNRRSSPPRRWPSPRGAHSRRSTRGRDPPWADLVHGRRVHERVRARAVLWDLAARARWRPEITVKRAPLLLLFLAVALAFGEVIGPERGLFFRDHLLVFKPLWYSVWTQLRAGDWPVLNL